MRLKKITIFLYVPSLFIRGDQDLTRNAAHKEISLVKTYIRNHFMDAGIRHINIHCYDPVIHGSWNNEWAIKVDQSDVQMFYIPQGHSSFVGRGYYEAYKKYHDLKKEQCLIYRRKVDGCLNMYGIDYISEKHNDDWNNYATLYFGRQKEAIEIVRGLQIKYRGDETLELPDSLKKYQSYQVVRVYHCAF